MFEVVFNVCCEGRPVCLFVVCEGGFLVLGRVSMVCGDRDFDG